MPLFYRRSTPVGPERFHLRLLRTLHGPPLVGLILGEILTPMQWLGAVLILGGVALSELWHPRKKRQEAL